MEDNLNLIIEGYKEIINMLSIPSGQNSSGKNTYYESYFDDSKFYDNFSHQKGFPPKIRRKRFNRKQRLFDEPKAHTCAN